MATRERMPCLCAVRTKEGWAMAPCGTKERCTKPATRSSGRYGTRSIHECFQCVDDDSQLAECLQSGADTPWSAKRRKSSIRRISFCAKLSLGGLEEPNAQQNRGNETTDGAGERNGKCREEEVQRLDLYAATANDTQSNKHRKVEQDKDRRKDAEVPSYFELGEDTNGTQGLPLGTPVRFQYHISDSQFKTPPVPITKQNSEPETLVPSSTGNADTCMQRTKLSFPEARNLAAEMECITQSAQKENAPEISNRALNDAEQCFLQDSAAATSTKPPINCVRGESSTFHTSASLRQKVGKEEVLHGNTSTSDSFAKSRKPDVVSDSSRARAEAMFANAEDEEGPGAPSHPPPADMLEGGMFRSGKGKAIVVSDSSRARAEAMFANAEDEEGPGAPSHPPPADMLEGGMFRSGKGKAIVVSDSSRARAEAMFANAEDEEGPGAPSHPPPADMLEGGMFRSGKGKAIVVSDSSRARAEAMFANAEDEEGPGAPSHPPPADMLEGGMFRSGKGKAIVVSDSSRARAEAMFANAEDEEGPGAPSHPPPADMLEGGMFRSGKGKAIVVSDSSRARAEAMFANAEDEEGPGAPSHPPPADMLEGGMFRSGKGKAIVVSDSSRARAEALLAACLETGAEEGDNDSKKRHQNSPHGKIDVKDVCPEPGALVGQDLSADPHKQKVPVAPTNHARGASTLLAKSETSLVEGKENAYCSTSNASTHGLNPGSSVRTNLNKRKLGEKPRTSKRQFNAPAILRENIQDNAQSTSSKQNKSSSQVYVWRGAVGQRMQKVPLSTAFAREQLIRKGTLIPCSLLMPSTETLHKQLLASGANPDFATVAWVKQQEKLIHWKLASYDMLKCANKGQLYSTKENIKYQLELRYWKECLCGKRPPLRRILEHDDPASRPMVLCVEEISEEEVGRDSKIQGIVVTDGWYSLTAKLDNPLSSFVRDGKIFVGCKLKVVGATLYSTGPQPPLEASGLAYLQLNANCTRRADPYAKLGFLRTFSGAVNLEQCFSEGGPIAATLLTVQRIYPIAYFETCGDGRKVFRSAAMEAQVQLRAEQVLENMEKDSEGDAKPDDCSILQRNVCPVLRAKVCGVSQANSHACPVDAQLTIWRPGEELTDVLKEGNVYCVTALNPRPETTRKIRLMSTTGKTSWRFLCTAEDCVRKGWSTSYTPRRFLSIPQISRLPFHSEFDAIFVVVLLGPRLLNGMTVRQWVFLADSSSPTSGDILAVEVQAKRDCCPPVDTLIPHKPAFSLNLRLERKDTVHGFWVGQASENSVFRGNFKPKEGEGGFDFDALQSWAQENGQYLTDLQVKLRSVIGVDEDALLSTQYEEVIY